MNDIAQSYADAHGLTHLVPAMSYADVAIREGNGRICEPPRHIAVQWLPWLSRAEAVGSKPLSLESVLEQFQLPARRVRIIDSNELELYFYRFPRAAGALLSAVDKLRRVFPGCSLLLEWYRDPEDDQDMFPLLTVRIRGYNDDALEKIREISIDALAKTEDEAWVLVTTDFGDPNTP